MVKYYLDTSIWMDLYEDRKGYNGEPLGDFAWKLLSLIKLKKYKLIISDLLIRELESNYSLEEINGMFEPFKDIVEKIIATKEQRDEAKAIAKDTNIPPSDVLHAILARDNGMILVTRDNHFKNFEHISEHSKPEELI